MGNRFICMTKKDIKETGKNGIGSRSKRNERSKRRSLMEEELLHRQALSMAIQQHQLSQRFDGGSMSRRIGSTSSRRRNDLPDQLASNSKELPAEFLENIKTKKFILIHGEGFGAWCWYKTIALLEETGLVPTALDLTGSGIDLTDTNNVTTLIDYSKPLLDYLENLPEDEKVILVGHSAGGACISYALEHFPNKIAKAVFLCATMISDGQKPFDVFAEESLKILCAAPELLPVLEDNNTYHITKMLGSAELFTQESKFLIYGNGKDKPATGLMFEKEQMHGLYFNHSPTKDVALAMVSMRPIPLGPMMDKLSLTPEKYGASRRFYIQTLDDHALSPDVQEKLVRENPPEGVFKIKGSDHSPFFSKPQSLHKILVEIAQIP